MDQEFFMRPAEYSESQIIESILKGLFPIDSNLPPERELCGQLGVTRPTLRETLQRMARDGWIEIRHGKPTRVRNYLEEGNLAVLAAIAKHDEILPENFIAQLLTIRTLLAPTYSRLAIHNQPEGLRPVLQLLQDPPDTPERFAQADWCVHHALTVASGNAVFTFNFEWVPIPIPDFWEKIFFGSRNPGAFPRLLPQVNPIYRSCG